MRRFRRLRRAAGLAREQLSVRTGVSAGYTQEIEGCGANLTLTSLAQICAAFVIDAAELPKPPAYTMVRRSLPVAH